LIADLTRTLMSFPRSLAGALCIASQFPMSDLVTHAAVIGRFMLMPGIQPVSLAQPKGDCLVAHSYPERIEDPRRSLSLDVTDCTLFTVTHVGRGEDDVESRTMVEEVMEQAIQAVSEVTIWNKVQEVVGTTSSFSRQIGRLDLKYFLIEGSHDRVVAWHNPLFSTDRAGASMLAGLLANMIVQNGPSANPTPAIIRRVMAALDLINLGFYTEAFISTFALVDDLTQEVMKAGMAKKGLDAEAQKGLLRAIKEERLKQFLGNLAILCDWQSLESANEKLFKELMAANGRRNRIMHGSARLTRGETLESINTLLKAIDWLRTNPFAFPIPGFPPLIVAEGEFAVLPITPPHAEPSATSHPPRDA
jgi:hypothetical protein